MVKLAALFIILPLLITIPRSSAEVHQSLELTTGYTKIDYEELHENQSLLNTTFDEQAHSLEGIYQILFFDFLFFRGKMQYVTYPTASSSGDELELLNGFTSVGLIIPGSRPFQIAIIAESFYSRMEASSGCFGYGTMNGAYIYPLIDYTTSGGSSIYVKFPLFSNIGDRKELTAGISLSFTIKETLQYPYFAYQEAVILKVEYSKVELHFEGDRNVDTTLQSITASLGYKW